MNLSILRFVDFARFGARVGREGREGCKIRFYEIDGKIRFYTSAPPDEFIQGRYQHCM
jgi:hypothetical protein